MAKRYTDSSYAGPQGAAFADGFIYTMPSNWPTANTIKNGDEYYFRRTKDFLLTTYLRDESGAVTRPKVSTYYNSDGTDDVTKAKPRIMNGIVTTSGMWTLLSSSTYKNTTEVDPDYYYFWGQYGDTLGRKRDTTNSTGSWSGSGVDVFTNAGDWNYQSAPSGGTVSKVYSPLGNPATVLPGPPIVSNYSKTDRDTSRSACFYLLNLDAGIEVSNLEFYRFKAAITMYCGTGTVSLTLKPNVYLHDCTYNYGGEGICFTGGATDGFTSTAVIGYTNLQIKNNRFHMLARAGIGSIGGTAWWCARGGATPEAGGSVIEDNVFSYCTQSISSGSIYIQAHHTLNSDVLTIRYNSISYPGIGNFWQLDGHSCYAEYQTTDTIWEYNYSWEAQKSFHSNPIGGNGNIFRYNIGLASNSRTNYYAFTLSGATADPLVVRLTDVKYNIVAYYPCFLFAANGWNNKTKYFINHNYSQGVNDPGVSTGSGIITQSNYIGSLGQTQADYSDNHLYGHTSGSAKFWYSQNWSGGTATSDTIPNQIPADNTFLPGNTERTAAQGYGINRDLNSNAALIAMLPHGGNVTLHSIETNYARQVSSTVWVAIGAQAAPSVGSVVGGPFRRES